MTLLFLFLHKESLFVCLFSCLLNGWLVDWFFYRFWLSRREAPFLTAPWSLFETVLSLPLWTPKGLSNVPLSPTLPWDGLWLSSANGTLFARAPLLPEVVQPDGGPSSASSRPSGLESRLFLPHGLCCGFWCPALDSWPLSKPPVEAVSLPYLHIILFVFLNWAGSWN